MKQKIFRNLAAAGLALAMCGTAISATVLKVASPTPEKGWFGDMHKWWAQEVEKRSKGEIKAQFFWSGSLVKWPDCLPGIKSGIADMCILVCRICMPDICTVAVSAHLASTYLHTSAHL